MPIHFFNADVSFKLEKKQALKKFIQSRSKKNLSLSFIFCSDEHLLQMNRQFLNHDFYTDIITFPLSETTDKIEAEIYISVDRVKDNAIKQKVNSDHEMHRVMFHGVLHLLGHADKSRIEKNKMTAAENLWLKKFDLYLSEI